jgi:hypothetical protein
VTRNSPLCNLPRETGNYAFHKMCGTLSGIEK